MAPISQRAARISIILNVILLLISIGFFVYSLMLKTVADRNKMEAVKQKQIAEEQYKEAEESRQKAESAVMEALKQHRQLQRKEDSIRILNQK